MTPDWENAVRRHLAGDDHLDGIIEVMAGMQNADNREAAVEALEKQAIARLSIRTGKKQGDQPTFAVHRKPAPPLLLYKQLIGWVHFMKYVEEKFGAEKGIYAVEAEAHTDWIDGRDPDKTGPRLPKWLATAPAWMQPVKGRRALFLRRDYFLFWVHLVGKDQAFEHADWPREREGNEPIVILTAAQWQEQLQRRQSHRVRALYVLATSALLPFAVFRLRRDMFWDNPEDGILYIRFNKTAVFPHGRLVPVIIAPNVVRRYLEHLDAEESPQALLFPPNDDLTSLTPCPYLSVVLNACSTDNYQVSASILRNTFLATALALPEVDAYVLYMMGTKSLDLLDRVQRYVDIAKQRPGGIGIPAELGYRVGTLPCLDCGMLNACDGSFVCSNKDCQAELRAAPLSADNLALAQLMRLVRNLWALHKPDDQVTEAMELIKEKLDNGTQTPH